VRADINIMRTGPDLTDAGDGFARLNLNSVSLAATMAAVQQARTPLAPRTLPRGTPDA
jgi:hypothetical protein